MEPNAWERAREAIARASERDEAVVTPDTAVSPFDASSTMVIPQADLTRRGGPDPDVTQRLNAGPGHPADGVPGPPMPRPPGDSGGPPPGFGPGWNGPGNGHAGHAPRVHDAGIDPAPWPAPRSTHLPPEPPTRPVEVSDPRGAPARVAGPRPDTAPFEAQDPGGGAADGAPRPAKRSWWRRLLGR